MFEQILTAYLFLLPMHLPPHPLLASIIAHKPCDLFWPHEVLDTIVSLPMSNAQDANQMYEASVATIPLLNYSNNHK